MGPYMDREIGRGVLYTWVPPKKEPRPVVMRTVTIVGEAPNKQGLSRYDTQTGVRLREWAGRELPWWNVFDELPERWSAREAKERVRIRMNTDEYADGTEPYILLGRKVCNAFRVPLDAEWLGWYRTPEHRHPMVALPHPSPLNRWYNQGDNRERAAAMVRAISTGELPHYDMEVIVDESKG